MAYPRLRLFVVFAAAAVYWTACAGAAEYKRKVNVGQPTELDWTFPIAKQSLRGTPPSWTYHGYESTRQNYEFFGPSESKTNADNSARLPLIIFVSPKDKAIGWKLWEPICRRHGFLYAGPYGTNKGSSLARRMRVALDVLHDVRKKYPVDPERTYISGFYGGARVSTELAYHLPEYFGGVIPIAAGDELPAEAWLQHQLSSKLSVVQLVGATDSPGRGNQRIGLTQVRHRHLDAANIRCKVHRYPGRVHLLPNSSHLLRAVQWLDQDLPRRRELAANYPSTSQSTTLSRHEQAQAVLRDAQKKLNQPESTYAGWLMLVGIQQRWPDLDAADIARQRAMELEKQDGVWKDIRKADQKKTLDREVAELRPGFDLDPSRGTFSFPKKYADLHHWVDSLPASDVSMDNATYDEAARKVLSRLDWRVGFNENGRVNFINLSGTRLSSKELVHFKQQLQGMPHVEAFDLSDMVMREDTLKQISDLRKLRALNVSRSDFSNKGMSCLADIPSIEFLSIASTKVNSKGLLKLPSFQSLKGLHLGGTAVDNEAISAISDAQDLRVLSLAGTRVTDDIANELPKLRQLEYLDLSSTKVGDETCNSLRQLEQLQTLVLGYTRISDTGVESLTHLPKLEELHLLRTNVSNRGMDSLRKMPQLRRLNVRGTRVSQSKVVELQKSLPNLSIQWNGNRSQSIADKKRILEQQRTESK